MHKNLIALPLTAFCLPLLPPAFAAEAGLEETEAGLASAEAGHEEAEAAAAAAPYVAWRRDLVRLMQGMAQCLAKVQDEASATAAAPEMAQHTANLRRLLEQEKELPPPSEDVQRHFRHNRLETEQAEYLADAALGRILELLLDQNPPCYGSEPLQGALLQFMDLFHG